MDKVALLRQQDKDGNTPLHLTAGEPDYVCPRAPQPLQAGAGVGALPNCGVGGHPPPQPYTPSLYRTLRPPPPVTPGEAAHSTTVTSTPLTVPAPWGSCQAGVPQLAGRDEVPVGNSSEAPLAMERFPL